MNDLRKESVTFVEIDDAAEGQRLDNFLFAHLKGVPKSHVYRLLRTGQVRVGGARVDAARKLAVGDILRIPPVRTATQPRPAAAAVRRPARLSRRIRYRDEALIVLDKPAGVAVHGGSGISAGVIEQLRAELPECRFLELAHRLDRETSGGLIVACRRSALVRLHDQFRSGEIDKRYLVLVPGHWPWAERHVEEPLFKYLDAEGERRVRVSAEGKPAHTVFRLLERRGGFSLLEAELRTGRTHQIRVHLAHLGYPIAGDDKYGDFARNREWARAGLRRMFLHAHRLSLRHPLSGETLRLEMPLPDDLQHFLNGLE